jgi:protoheme IX farnesyltransferase
MPVLIGWSAVTGRLSWAALVLFGIIFLWTPPHYWPLSMKVKEDYANAGVPMLPVLATNEAVAKQIVAYSWVMVAVSLALWPLGHTSFVYPATALVLGAMWLKEAHGLLARAKAGVVGAKLKEMRLFHWSITYLTLLFVEIAIDPFLK